MTNEKTIYRGYEIKSESWGGSLFYTASNGGGLDIICMNYNVLIGFIDKANVH